MFVDLVSSGPGTEARCADLYIKEVVVGFFAESYRAESAASVVMADFGVRMLPWGPRHCSPKPSCFCEIW